MPARSAVLLGVEYMDPHQKCIVNIRAGRQELLSLDDRDILLAGQSRTVQRMRMLIDEVDDLTSLKHDADGEPLLDHLIRIATSRALVREVETRLISSGHLVPEATAIATVENLDDYRSHYCRQQSR